MGATFEVLNFTRRERLSFSALGADKAREIACTPNAAALAVWYAMRFRGDQLAFVSDYDRDPIFGTNPRTAITTFTLINEREIRAAIDAGVLVEDDTVHVNMRPGSRPDDDLHPSHALRDA